LIIYDIPDEIILSGDFEKNPRNFAYADGIVIMVDPLSIQSVREECLRKDGKKAVVNYSVDDIGTIIIQFIHKFSEIKGLPAETIFDIPVAVIIGKADINTVKQEIGLSEIKTKYTANPAAYGNNLLTAREKICREYLSNIGLTNALNNLEGVFSNIQYFPVSAIGHLSESSKAFEPLGVMEPVTWLAGIGNAGMYKALKNVQDITSKKWFSGTSTSGVPLLKRIAGLYMAFKKQVEKIKKFR
jgi:hypothetical protein